MIRRSFDKTMFVRTMKEILRYSLGFRKRCKEYAKMFEEYVPELGNLVDFPHSIIVHNRPAPVSWSGINFHK